MSATGARAEGQKRRKVSTKRTDQMVDDLTVIQKKTDFEDDIKEIVDAFRANPELLVPCRAIVRHKRMGKNAKTVGEGSAVHSRCARLLDQGLARGVHWCGSRCVRQRTPSRQQNSFYMGIGRQPEASPSHAVYDYARILHLGT